MDETLTYWKQAGKIAGEAREYGKTLLKEDANVFEIAIKIEEFIAKKGAKPGFPVQVSINDLAAHYTPFINDTLCLKAGDLVKLDLGAHVEGHIGDTAVTVEVGTKNQTDLLKSSKEALDAAIKLAKPGTQLWQIGEAVEQAITKYGFKPIKNLSGHKVDRWVLHSNLSIPNFNNQDKTELTEGIVVAIEPFSSTGDGMIREGKPSSNYRWPGTTKMPRDTTARKILEFVKKEIGTIPFAERHLVKLEQPTKIRWALAQLEKEGILYQYPQLPEISKGLVSQHEHTIYIGEKPIVLTDVE